MCSICVYTIHIQHVCISARLRLEMTRGDVADDLYAAAVVQARPYIYDHVYIICAHTMYKVRFAVYVYEPYTYMCISAQLRLEMTRGDVADVLYAAAVVQARPYIYDHMYSICVIYLHIS